MALARFIGFLFFSYLLAAIAGALAVIAAAVFVISFWGVTEWAFMPWWETFRGGW